MIIVFTLFSVLKYVQYEESMCNMHLAKKNRAMRLVFGTYLIVTFGFLLFASCVRLLWLHICVMLDLIHQLQPRDHLPVHNEVHLDAVLRPFFKHKCLALVLVRLEL